MVISSSAIDITTGQRKTILELLKRHLPDTEAWAYGSRVKWTSRPQSDLDMVVFAAPEQARAVSDLREAFEESNLPFRVDLFIWDTVPDSFRKQIERDHAVLTPPAPNSLSPEGRGSGRGGNPRPAAPDSSQNAPPRQSQDEQWRRMSFAEAVVVNPSVRLERGTAYPFVDMAAITAGARCVHARSVGRRDYSGSGSRFQVGDTLMARITPCLENGKIARYCADKMPASAHGSTEFIVIRGRSGITDSEYAYYLTRWEEVRNYAVDQMTGTSGRQRVPVDSLGYLTVPVPPLAEQRAIASVFGALDDKIELNRRMNRTLEAMAGALFKSWFVDFDLVRAKMALKRKVMQADHSPLEGESAHQPAGAPVGGNVSAEHSTALAGGSASAGYPPPHQPSPVGSASATPPQGGSGWTAERARACLDSMDAEIAALFPDALDEEGKPVGWTFSEIGKEVEAVGGGTPSTRESSYWNDGQHHWATPKDLSRLMSPVLIRTDRKITDAGISKISSGLLPIGTVLLSSRAPIGYLAITEVPTAVNQGFIAMICQKRLPNTFVLFWCRENLGYIKDISGGSTFAEISKRAFRPIPVLVPSEKTLAAYDRFVRSLYVRIVANTKENESLAQIRDLLLPKLMAGEVRLRTAERIVDAEMNSPNDRATALSCG